MKKTKIVTADSLDTNYKRTPSGVFSFDVLTGGGIPEGKITIFHGNKSSGKTTMMLKIIGNYLEQYPEKQVLYVDLENSLDTTWMRNFIEEDALNRVVIINPIYGEEAVDITIELLKREETNIGFLGVDSLANLLPVAEVDQSAMDFSVGSHARLVNKLIRKLLVTMSAYNKENKNLTVLFLNQIRVKIGAKAFTAAYTKTGGSYQDFVAHLDVRFYFIEDVILRNIPVKRKHQFRIEKSKINNCLPHTKGEFSIITVPFDDYVVGQSDDYNLILNYAKKYKVLQRDKSTWVFGKKVFKKLAEVMVALKEDDTFFIDLYQKTRDVIIKNILPPEEG